MPDVRGWVMREPIIDIDKVTNPIELKGPART